MNKDTLRPLIKGQDWWETEYLYCRIEAVYNFTVKDKSIVPV